MNASLKLHIDHHDVIHLPLVVDFDCHQLLPVHLGILLLRTKVEGGSHLSRMILCAAGLWVWGLQKARLQRRFNC